MGAKITCIHNSLYLHLHFKNYSDTFCKYNTLLEVPHATQLLTNNFVKGQFYTPRKYTKKHTQCVLLISSGVCMLLAQSLS